MHMQELITAWIAADIMGIVKAGSYFGVSAFVFAESGVLIGLLLPGDSLLFAAGFLASAGWLRIEVLVPLVIGAAILGDSVGYWTGARLGQRLMRRPSSRFFKHEYIQRTQHFFEEYGGRAVILARFVPIVRTLAPMLSGVGSMRYSTFLSYNVIGGCLWGGGVTLLGYFLGAIFPDSERYILPIMLVIIIVSIAPIAREYVRHHRSSST
jgi:membrane-associated protein